MGFVANLWENTTVKIFEYRTTFVKVINECTVAQFFRLTVSLSISCLLLSFTAKGEVTSRKTKAGTGRKQLVPFQYGGLGALLLENFLNSILKTMHFAMLNYSCSIIVHNTSKYISHNIDHYPSKFSHGPREKQGGVQNYTAPMYLARSLEQHINKEYNMHSKKS